MNRDCFRARRTSKPLGNLSVGLRQNEQLAAGRRSFAEAYSDFAKATNLVELKLDPDALFADTRALEPGRDIASDSKLRV